MNQGEQDEADITAEGLTQVFLKAPKDTIDRFRRRASILQGTRTAFDGQIYAFWVVLHTFLKLLFKHPGVPVTPGAREQALRYRRAILRTKGARR